MSELEVALHALESAPIDLDRFLEQVHPVIRRIANRFPDPDEVAQLALIRVQQKHHLCHAKAPGALGAWLRRLVWRCGCSYLNGRLVELELPPLEPATESEPHLGWALDRALERARVLDVESLSPADRAVARRWRVARSLQTRREHLDALVALRIDGEASAAIAEARNITRAAVKAGAVRGAAAVALAARVLSRDATDLMQRDAFSRIVERQDCVGAGHPDTTSPATLTRHRMT